MQNWYMQSSVVELQPMINAKLNLTFFTDADQSHPRGEIRARFVQGRGNRFLVGGGGCIPKFGPPSIPGPPQKHFSVKQNFSGKCWRRGWGGGGRRYVSENKISQNLSQHCNTTFPRKFQNSAHKSFIFTNFAIPACQGPLPKLVYLQLLLYPC